MISYSVNGEAKDLELSGESTLREMLSKIRGDLINETTWISSIRVDGRELTEADEREYAVLPLSQVRVVEVSTCHPRELADETIRFLIDFTNHLIPLSRNTAASLQASRGGVDFAKLIDGISTFIEAMGSVRKILRIGYLPTLNILEADMASILKDVLDFYEQGQMDYVAELLDQHLPSNLEQWRSDALPALMRSRDS